jgi:predicted protein tyrosine phosphatase
VTRSPERVRFDRISELVHVGSRITSEDEYHLARAHGIRACVDMREEASGLWPFEAFLWLPTVDHLPPSVSALRTGIAFLRECERLRLPVLVQCLMGVGRSVTLVLAYLLAGSHREAGTQAALDLIKARRPEACPTREQVLTAEAAARAFLDGERS